MRWIAPEMLWSLALLALPAALYIWAWRRRKKLVLTFSTIRVLKIAATPGGKCRRQLPPDCSGSRWVLG